MMDLHSFGGAHVVVWGDGIEGQGAVRWFGPRAAKVTIVVDSTPALQEALASADVIIRSPGVNPRRTELTGRPVTTLTDLWLATPRSAPVVGVTGTKGKSTTTVVTTRLLQAAGVRVGMGGNIEIPVTDLPDDCDAYVIEVSSYMASDLTHSPNFGVLTNLGDDHVSWHGGLAQYRHDKLNLFAHDQLRNLAVNGIDAASMEMTAALPRTEYGTRGYTRSGSVIANDGVTIADLSGTNLGNDHFALNTCAALTAAEWVVGSPVDDHVLAVAQAYEPLPSRLATVAVHGGITFVDDALASNPTGTMASVAAFEGRALGVIVGGTDRTVELGALVDSLADRAARAPTTMICISDLGPRLAAMAAERGLDHALVDGDDFDLAVPLAAAAAAVGDDGVVLFSPGAATPAAIGNYKQRSERFQAAVRGLIAG